MKGNIFELVVPGSASLQSFQQAIALLERNCGMAVLERKLSASQYYSILRDLYFSVPLTESDDRLTLEQKDAILEKAMGCSKTVFLSRVRTRLRQHAQHTATAKALKR